MFDEPTRKRKIKVEAGEAAGLPKAGEAEEQVEAEAEPVVEGLVEEPVAAEPTCEERIAQLEADLAAERDGRLRALAELQNFRRRTQEDREQQMMYANERLLFDLLLVLDHFEMACDAAEATEETQIVCKGYEMVLAQLRDVMARYGLSEIPAEGVFFDPAVHEAVESQALEEPCEGTILKVLRKGYKLHERVLRPAQVVVAVRPES